MEQMQYRLMQTNCMSRRCEGQRSQIFTQHIFGSSGCAISKQVWIPQSKTLEVCENPILAHMLGDFFLIVCQHVQRRQESCCLASCNSANKLLSCIHATCTANECSTGEPQSPIIPYISTLSHSL